MQARLPLAGRLLSVALLTLTLFATAPEASGGAAAQGRSAFILLPRTSFLYARPNEDAERVRDPWHDQYGVRVGPYFVLRKGRTQNGFVEVRTLPEFEAGMHCYPTVAGLDDLLLRFYVRESEVATVTTHPVSQEFADGTSLRLAAGVGLTRRGGQAFEAIVPGATLRVRLPASDISQSYQAAEVFPLGGRAVGMLAAGARVEFHQGSLETEAASRARRRSNVVDFTRGGGGDDGPSRALLAVETDQTGRGRLRGVIHSRCAEITGDLSGRQISRDRPRRSARTLGDRHGTTVRENARLYWPDGSRAGRVARATSLDGRMTRREGRACFEHRLREAPPRSPDEALSLCVDLDQVVR